MEIMEKSNCYQKTVHVTARFLKAVWDQDRDRIGEALTVDDILVAKVAQFQVSMGPTVVAASNGELDCLRPVEKGGIIYLRGRCDKSLPSVLGVEKLPILARHTRLAKLIMIAAHEEDHRSTATDVLARSMQKAWIIRGRYPAREVCKSCPWCKLLCLLNRSWLIFRVTN